MSWFYKISYKFVHQDASDEWESMSILRLLMNHWLLVQSTHEHEDSDQDTMATSNIQNYY